MMLLLISDDRLDRRYRSGIFALENGNLVFQMTKNHSLDRSSRGGDGTGAKQTGHRAKHEATEPA